MIELATRFFIDDLEPVYAFFEKMCIPINLFLGALFGFPFYSLLISLSDIDFKTEMSNGQEQRGRGIVCI